MEVSGAEKEVRGIGEMVKETSGEEKEENSEEEEARREEGGQEHSEEHGREAKEMEEARERGLTMEWEVRKAKVKVEKEERAGIVGRQVTKPGIAQTEEVRQEEGKKEKEKAKTIRG